MNNDLTGGLFPARGKPKPLDVSKSALSLAQSHSEDDHLMSYFNWTKLWELQYPQLGGRRCFHVENERLLAPVTVKRKSGKEVTYGPGYKKRQLKGIKRGVADVLNLRPSPLGFTYFVGELKVLDGELSDEQAEFIAQARAAGAFAHTVWCWSELARLTLYYFLIDDRMVYQSAGKPEIYLVPKYGGHNERCGCEVKI
ncbi:MAG TPA: hypothetical protein VF525_08065 [Pyrinomonadaceae bacterium]|jgi:hypothetical protein